MVGAEGKLGKVTYYRSGGETIAREIVPVKNPQTDLQTLQRVISKQVAANYKKFQNIADHSFEGVTNGKKCMDKFRSMNMKALRRRAAEIQAAGQSLSQYYNFQPIGSDVWVPGRTILAQGQLTKIVPFVMNDNGLYLGALHISENTYAGVAAALHAKRGDQLTFITVEKQNDEYMVFKSRIILDPRNADGSGAVMTEAFVDGGAINLPNWKNDFEFSYLHWGSGDGGVLSFAHGDNGSTLVACAVIASRKDGDEWLRSNAELVVSEDALGSDKCSLYDAIASSYSADSVDMESELYLNNAGVGGGQGSDESAGGLDPSEPYYNPSVSINGVSQNVSGGSVAVTAPLTTIVINGRNLSDATTVIKQGGNTIQPTSKNATSITFSGLSFAAGDTVDVYQASADTERWFRINVQAAGGNNTPGGDE